MAQPRRQEPQEVEELERELQQGFRFVLSQPTFRLIWVAQVAAQMADKFLMFSLIILAFNLSGGSTQVAVVLLAYTLPSVFMGPPAGVFADRHDRKRIMVGSNLGRAAIVALIPLSSYVPGLSHDFIHLFVLTLAFSTVGQLFSPAEAAAIPSVLPKPALLTANSMVMITMVLTLLVGVALAPIVSKLNLYAPYWLATILFAVGGMLIWATRIPRTPDRMDEVDRHPFHQMAVEVQEGLRYLGGSRLLMTSFLQLSLAVLVIFMMFTLAPSYVRNVIGIPAQDTYIIMVPAAGGAFVSAGLLGRLERMLKRSRVLWMSLLATGLTLVALGVVPVVMREVPQLRGDIRWFTVVFSLLVGLEFGGLMIPSLTYLMEHTHDEVRGRVFSLLFVVVNGLTALPVLVAAALADLFGTNRVIGGLGLLLAIAGVALATFGSAVYGREGSPPRPRSPVPTRPSQGPG
ncbi:MAG: MFS transporter [Candidatus Dormibacteraceae bacterium]